MAVTLPTKIVTLTFDDRKAYRELKQAFVEAESAFNQWLRAFKQKYAPQTRNYAPFEEVDMAILDEYLGTGDPDAHAVFEKRLKS